MICSKCKTDISGDCVLITGVCVFCHYNTKTWDSNGQLVTKDNATRGIGWWTEKDLDILYDICKALAKNFPYSTNKLYDVLTKCKSVDVLMNTINYALSFNISLEQAIKDLKKGKK